MCGEGFLNGQLTVTRGLGDFGPDAPAAALQQPPRARERLKYRSSLDGEPLQLMGPLTSGAGANGLWPATSNSAILQACCTASVGR